MSEAIDHSDRPGHRKYVSERGGFEIFDNTRITPPGPKRPVDVDQVAAYFEHSTLADKYGERFAPPKLLLEMAKKGEIFD